MENVPPKFQPASQSSISDKTQRPIRPNRGNQLTGDARDEAVRSNRATPIGDPTKISVDKANGSTDWMPHVEGIKQGGAETGGVDPQTASKPRFKNFKMVAGHIHTFNVKLNHTMINDGNADRVTLSIDLKKNQWVEKFLETFVKK